MWLQVWVQKTDRLWGRRNGRDDTSAFGVDGRILCIIMFYLFVVAATRNLLLSYYGEVCFRLLLLICNSRGAYLAP